MWMMGYDEGGDLSFGSDSFDNGRKLRPLIPRPISSSPPLNLVHTNDFFSQFHHMDQSKRELNNAPPALMVVSSRWNPTPEQLRLLEELYRRGTRTPSADQIQHITAQLRRFGKIEGKNVFYWFQNHKARERQKRRRQMESNDHSARDIEILERKDSGSGRTTVYEVEHTKNWPPSTNCSTLLEETVAIQRAAKASHIMAARDCRAENGWLQFEELHQRRNNNNFAEKNGDINIIINNNNNPASLQLMHCSATALGSNQLMMNTPPITTTATVTTTIMHQKCHNNISSFVGLPYEQNRVEEELEDLEDLEEEEEEEGGGGGGCNGESETLQLFPLCSDTRNGQIIGGKNGCEIVESSGMNSSTNLTPLQFFEFLPLKN